MNAGYCIGGPSHGKLYKVDGPVLHVVGADFKVIWVDPQEPIRADDIHYTHYTYVYRNGFWRLN